jgi:hypothetical protein
MFNPGKGDACSAPEIARGGAGIRGRDPQLEVVFVGRAMGRAVHLNRLGRLGSIAPI